MSARRTSSSKRAASDDAPLPVEEHLDRRGGSGGRGEHVDLGTETAIRIRRRSLVAAAGFPLAAAIAYFFLVARAYNLDLVVYRSAIRWWWGGHDPYARSYSIHHLAFTYPPFAFVALSPLAVLPAGLAKLLWFLVNIAALTGSLFIVFRSLKWRGSPDLWLVAVIVSSLAVFVVEPVRSTIDYGQVNAVIMVACLFDLLGPTFRWRGVLIGCAGALKLTPLIFVLFFLVKRDVKSLSRTAAAFAVSTGLAWLVLPGPSHQFWTKLAWEPERTGKLSYPGNLSWDAVIVRMGPSSAGARYLWAAFVVVTLVVGAMAATRCVKAGSDTCAVLVVAITGLLVSPISWSHHWVWLVMAIPLLLSPNELNRPIRVMLAGLLLLAVVAPYWWFPSGWIASLAEAVTPIWAFALLSVTCVSSVRPGTSSVGAGTTLAL